MAYSADITYIPTSEAWLYLPVVLDLFDRGVVGWSMKDRMKTDIVSDALRMAWFRRKPQAGALHHSDRLNPPNMPVMNFRHCCASWV